MKLRGVLAAMTVLVCATPSPAAAHAPPGAVGGGPVATPSDAQQTIALRQRYFGAANVDATTGAVRRDKLIMSWFGVTNFAMAIRGHVILLDAWVPRGGSSGYVPSSPDELAALKPEAIFIGHAHFDHAADSVPIAQASGAMLVGSADHCAELRSRAPAMPPPCLEALPAAAPPGTTAPITLLRGVDVRIVKHLHSAAKSPNGEGGYHVPVTPAPSTTQLEHPATPEDMAQLVEHAPDAEAGTVLYRFEVGDLTLVWNDSAGPLIEDAPDTFNALRALRPVDIHVGAIQGFNQISNGMRDPRTYVEAIHSKLFVPAHHDDWAAGITTKGENYRKPLTDELSLIPEADRPAVRFIADPTDYVRPEVLAFDVKLDRARLTRRCIGGGRLRVRLRGDLADVGAIAVRFGAKQARVDAEAPFEGVFDRAALARRGRQRLIAVVTDVDGSHRTLRRNIPSCGVKRRA